MTSRFRSTMTVIDSWQASTDEVVAFLDAMITSLTKSGCSGIRVDGQVRSGEFFCEFDLPNDGRDERAALHHGVVLTILALKSAKVAAPGWPDGDTVEGAVASVNIQELASV